MSDGIDDTTNRSRRSDGSQSAGSGASSAFGTSAEYTRAQAFFATLERDGHLDGVVRRSKRLVVAGLVVALLAYDFSPGGLSGVILDLWGMLAFGFAALGLAIWLAASAFERGELGVPESTDDGGTLDLETVGAPLLVSLADRTHTSAGVRLLWSLLLGEATLPAASAVAAETNAVTEQDVARLRRVLTQAAVASVAVVGVDLLVRVVGITTVLRLGTRGGTGELPSPPGLAQFVELLTLSPAGWLAVFLAALVVGGVVGLGLAVTFKR